MQTVLKRSAFFGILFVVAFPLWADISIPTVTKVYFEKGGQPYRRPVDFAVKCYGYDQRPGPGPQISPEKKPGTYTPQPVFSYFAKCPDYGCEVHENYYLNYRHIDYCNAEGKAEGKDFKIEKYASNPVEFSTCKAAEGKNRLQRNCSLKLSLP